MTLATSHGSAERPNASRVTSSSRVSWSMALDRNGCMARLGDTALTRTPAGAARRFGQTPLMLVADGDGGAFLGAALGRGEPDTRACGRRHQQRLALEQPAARRVRRRLSHAGLGSGGKPSARSPMMLRWISL